MRLKVGDQASITKKITAEDIRAFANLSGDFNPVHLDPVFAATTPFKKCIAHGMMGASFISTLLATKLPGPGTIYLSQTLNFKKPVFVDDEITFTATIKNAREDKPIFTIETNATNHAGEIVIAGEALVRGPTIAVSSYDVKSNARPAESISP